MTDLSLRFDASGYPPAFLRQLSEHAATGRGALLMLAIENLPMMVSGYGVEQVERFIAGLHQAIQAELPTAMHVARVQRDQFACLLDAAEAAGRHEWCQKIEAMVRRYSSQSHEGVFYCLPRAVAVAFGDVEATPEDVFARALSLLCDVRTDVVSDQETATDIAALSRQHLETANMLTAAMEENRFRLAFQPIIESKTGKVAHYEALLRLYSRDGKISSAGTLIPIAERMGIVHLLDELALEMVVRELRGDAEVMIAFNVSNHTTRSPGWMNKFRQYLSETPDIASRMICEITETAAHRDLGQVARFCSEVQGLGAWVALDDFGSGYTSFRQLKALSVDIVKIDGSFIKDLSDNADNRFFVKTLLDFTQGFGLKSVAEFVENGETAKMLMELGVDYLQGYYFGKPENIRRWLNQGEYSRG